MINLLPTKEKMHLRREYNLRLAVVYLALFVIVSLVGLVLLLPSYFLADIRQNEAEREIQSVLNSTESSEREAINEELRLTKERLAALTKDNVRIELYKVLDEIALQAGSEILLSQFSYTRGKGEENSSLRFSGVAETRSNLLTFTRNLESNELFESIDLPVASLAKDKDIPFSVVSVGTF